MRAVLEAPRQTHDQAPGQETEVMNLDYGAFIQVLQKSGKNISYVSYALPRGINDTMLDSMMTGILYPESPFKGDVKPERFSDKDLPLLHRPGMHIDALDRLVSVPRHVLENDHSDKEIQSMRKYEKTYPLIMQELPGIKRDFIDSLFSATPQPKVADGVHIYHGAYRFENGSAIGLNLAGTEEFDLLKLATDQGHQDQMEHLVSLFAQYENVTVVLSDKTKTVSDCAASCSRFFEEKERLSGVSFSSLQLDSYQSNILYPGMYSSEKRSSCDTCKKSTSNCVCEKAE